MKEFDFSSSDNTNLYVNCNDDEREYQNQEPWYTGYCQNEGSQKNKSIVEELKQKIW